MPENTIFPFTTCLYNLEVITPTFIGDTSDKDYMLGEDYFYDDDALAYCFINKKEFQMALTASERSEYTSSLLKSDADGAEKIIKAACLKNQSIVYKRVRCPYFDGAGKKVRKHITNGFGNIYIPGSSIKGAVRSMAGKYLMGKLYKSEFRHEELFGRIDNNLMRMIQVGDVTVDKPAGIYAMKVYSGDVAGSIKRSGNDLVYEGEGRWKHKRVSGHDLTFNIEGFVTIFETLQPGSTGRLRINFTNFEALKKMPPDKYPVNAETIKELMGDQWLEIARSQTNEYLEQEAGFFSKFRNSDFPEAISLVDQLQSMNNSAGAALLRLGQGSGYHAITGNWKYKDHTQTGQATERDKRTREETVITAIKYKTRKIAFTDKGADDVTLMLPGFVRISKL